MHVNPDHRVGTTDPRTSPAGNLPVLSTTYQRPASRSAACRSVSVASPGCGLPSSGRLIGTIDESVPSMSGPRNSAQVIGPLRPRWISDQVRMRREGEYLAV